MGMCVYPLSFEGGINLFWGSQGFHFFLDRAETSQEGSCGRKLEEISATNNLGYKKTNSKP